MPFCQTSFRQKASEQIIAAFSKRQRFNFVVDNVWHGDSRTPLLFNLSVDNLSSKLNESGCRLSNWANPSADDIQNVSSASIKRQTNSLYHREVQWRLDAGNVYTAPWFFCLWCWDTKRLNTDFEQSGTMRLYNVNRAWAMKMSVPNDTDASLMLLICAACTYIKTQIMSLTCCSNQIQSLQGPLWASAHSISFISLYSIYL